jgi:hypothetical protein
MQTYKNSRVSGFLFESNPHRERRDAGEPIPIVRAADESILFQIKKVEDFLFLY